MSDNLKVHNERNHILVGPNDVILGRGNHLNNAGNEKFLDIVRSRSMEYWSCIDNADKDTIARQVVDTVKSFGGRFLRSNANSVRSIDSSMHVKPNMTNSTVVRWEIASNHTVLTKVKQSFRDLTASAKKRTASSKANENPARFRSLPIDQHLDEAELSNVVSSIPSHEKAALLTSTSQSLQNPNTSTSQLSLMVQVDSSNVKQTFRDHSSSAKERIEFIKSGGHHCNSNTVTSMNQNDQGMLLLSAPQCSHDSLSVNELTSQSYSFETDNNTLDLAASFQQLNDSFIEHRVASQSDLMHRIIVDQQMLALMREQQSRFPKALQLASATNSGTSYVDHMNRNCSNDVVNSLIRTKLQQQQQHRSIFLQHHINLDAFRQQQPHTDPNQPHQVALLPTVPSIESQQSSSSFDALLSQLSPLELANIHSTLLANQLAPSMYNSSRNTSGLAVPTDTDTQLSNFHANGGNTGNITSVDVLRDLQQAHLRNNDDTLDAKPKPDSDADSNEDQKPPGRL